MDITKKNRDDYTVDATIALATEEVMGYVAKAKEGLTGHVAVQGFRKGKAPKHLAEQQLSERMVREEALEIALSESFTQAVTQEGWDVARTSDLKVEQNDASGLRYHVTVQLWPAVVLADLDSVKVPRKAVTASDIEIDEALEEVRNMRATFLDKTGPAATGDRVEVDFDASVDGKPVEGGSSRNHPLIIGGRSFMPGFEEELIGLAVDATKEFSLQAPADYYEPKLAGKNVAFTITVRRVQTVLKPAGDDAFAKTLGGFETLAQLRHSLKDGIIAEKTGKEQQRVRLAILDALIAASTVPTPPTMVHEELDSMLGRFSNDLRERGIELTMYLAKLGKTEEQLRADWQSEAERQTRIMLVLRGIIQGNHIGVTAGELDTAFHETVAALIRTGQATEEQIDPERLRAALSERMLRDKALEFVEHRCATA